MMCAATNNKYDGCCDETVKHHVTLMALEGKNEVAAFHAELARQGIKPAASGDLWSKNGVALFGLVSHGIRRHVVVDPVSRLSVPKWTLVEKLCGSVPCKQKRHTSEYIGELSDEAWANSGLSDPIADIFARVSDNGSNMIKGWEEGFQVLPLRINRAPCLMIEAELAFVCVARRRHVLTTLSSCL